MNNTRVFKFSLKAFIEKVIISLNFPCKMQVAWKRGNQKLETKQSDLHLNVANFNEQLEMNSNLYLEDNKFKEKKCAFTVTLYSEKGNKVAGSVSIDISQYLNKKVDKIREEFKLEKCPDKHARIHVRLEFICIEELDIDQLSRMSYATNQDEQAEQLTNKEPQKEIQTSSQQSQPITNQNLQQENTEHEQEINEIRIMLNNSLKKIQQKDNQISLLQQEIQTKQEQLNDTKTQLEQTKNKLYETLDKLQNYEEQVQNIADFKKNMQQKITQLETYGQQCTNQISELNEQLKNKQQQLNQADSKLSSSLGQIQVFKQRITQYEQQEQQQEQRKSIKNNNDMEIMQRKTQELEKQLQREQTKQEQDYALYQVKLKNLENQIVDKVEQINRLKNPNQDITNKKEIEQYQQKEDQFNKILQQYKDQIQKLMQNEKKIKSQHQQEIDTLSEQVGKLKCQLGDIFNSAYDVGGNKLVDILQQAVGLQ